MLDGARGQSNCPCVVLFMSSYTVYCQFPSGKKRGCNLKNDLVSNFKEKKNVNIEEGKI